MNQLKHFIRPIAAAALLLATAACTKDEPTDGDRLPEGQYPLEIARITLGVEGGEAQPWGAPQTRVSENADGTGSVWEWDGSEMIGVQLGDKTTTYTLNTDHTLLAGRQLYWTSTAPNQPVTAWYPATDGTLDLSDQSQSLAYLLGATGTKPKSCLPAGRHGHGRLPDPRHPEFHPRSGEGARHAFGQCTRRGAEPPALYLHPMHL